MHIVTFCMTITTFLDYHYIIILYYSSLVDSLITIFIKTLNTNLAELIDIKNMYTNKKRNKNILFENVGLICKNHHNTINYYRQQ